MRPGRYVTTPVPPSDRAPGQTGHIADHNELSAAVAQLQSQVAAGLSGAVQLGGDLGGSNSAPQVLTTHLLSPLPASQGGTGQASALTAANVGADVSGAAATAQAAAQSYTDAETARAQSAESSLSQQITSLQQSSAITVLQNPFSSSTGTGVQPVTGMSVPLPVALLKIRMWAPILPAGTTGSTQVLSWTFSGTASAALVTWKVSAASSFVFAQSASLTSSITSPAMTAAGFLAEWEAVANVTAAGTLQLTIASTTSGDEATFPVGCSISVQPAVY